MFSVRLYDARRIMLSGKAVKVYGYKYSFKNPFTIEIDKSLLEGEKKN